jgi:hypothetical protein
VLQGFTRADIGFTFYLGMAFACVVSPQGRFALPRFLQAGVSLAAAALTAGIQFYLMHFVYPHASYGDTPVFQARLNLTEPVRWVPFVLFVAPTLWLVFQVLKKRIRLQAPQLGLVLGSVLFFCMWALLGKIDEVRIFMPFSFALTPLTVETALQEFFGDERRSSALLQHIHS